MENKHFNNKNKEIYSELYKYDGIKLMNHTIKLCKEQFKG